MQATPIVGTGDTKGFETAALAIFAIEAFMPVSMTTAVRKKPLDYMRKAGQNPMYITGWQLFAWGNLAIYSIPFIFYLNGSDSIEAGAWDTFESFMSFLFIPLFIGFWIADISIFSLAVMEFYDYIDEEGGIELTSKTAFIELLISQGLTFAFGVLLTCLWFL